MYGVTLVITGSRIFAPVRTRVFRDWHFVRCPMCVGWWVGLAVGLAGYGAAAWGSWPAVAQAFAGSGFCWVTHVVLVRLGSERL